MAGNPDNATLWLNADVFIADASADLAFNTTTGAFTGTKGEASHLVGLLDGETGFNHTREIESNDRYAWGGILVRSIHRNPKHGFSMTLLEDNPVTRQLVWPGSTDTVIKVARPVLKWCALRVSEGSRVLIRQSIRPVEFMVDGEIPENETDITSFPMAATVFPNAQGDLWSRRLIAPA